MSHIDVKLRCCNGHETVKYKKLKPWQDRLPSQQPRRCSLCSAVISRDDFRWRCEHHCESDICEYCYDVHWTGVIERASRTTKLKERVRLLNEIPQHLRKIPEFQEAAEWEPPAASSSSSRARSNGNRSSARGTHAGGDDSCGCEEACQHMQTALWVLIWVIAMLFVGKMNEAILLSKAFRFPNVWLMVSLSQVLAFLIGQIIVCMSRQAILLGADPEWKAAVCTGLMRGLQISLGTNCIRSSSVAAHGVLHALLYPSLIFALEVIRETESIHDRGLVLSMVFAAIGGCLAVCPMSKWEAVQQVLSSDKELQNLFDAAVWVAAGGALAALRLVHTRELLVLEDVHRRLFSPLLLATRMSFGAFIPGLEISALVDGGCYSKLLELPQPGQWMTLIAALAAGQIVLVIAELQLLQNTSAVFVGGLLVPWQGALAALLKSVMGGLPVPPFVWSGIAFLTVAAGMFARTRQLDNDAGNEGYRRLPNGQRPRGSRRDRGNPHVHVLSESDEDQTDWL